MFKRSLLPSYVDQRQIATRAHVGPLLKIQLSNSAQYDRSVEYHGASCWNSLPPGRRLATTYNIFKKETAKYLKSAVPLVVA